jgi:hypothetical protein
MPASMFLNHLQLLRCFLTYFVRPGELEDEMEAREVFDEELD